MQTRFIPILRKNATYLFETFLLLCINHIFLNNLKHLFPLYQVTTQTTSLLSWRTKLKLFVFFFEVKNVLSIIKTCRLAVPITPLKFKIKTKFRAFLM